MIFGGTLSITFIAVGNGVSDLSSNPKQVCWHISFMLMSLGKA